MSEPMICLVTGANTGLGYETSLGLAKDGHHVILACRNEDKARTAMSRIEKAVSNASLEFVPLDLIDRESVLKCAEIVADRHNHLDRLINNAGVMGPPETITPNGVELQFDANHLGHFLLTKALMPLLEASREARIVNLASLAGKRETADILFENINHDSIYNDGPEFMGLPGMGAYQQSKLANILFTRSLVEKLAAKGSSIKVVVVHPGASYTDLMRHMSFTTRLFGPILARFMAVSKPVDGAKPTLLAALGADVATGDFYGPTGKEERIGPAGPVDYPPKSLEPGLAEKLWTLSEEMLGTTFNI